MGDKLVISFLQLFRQCIDYFLLEHLVSIESMFAGHLLELSHGHLGDCVPVYSRLRPTRPLTRSGRTWLTFIVWLASFSGWLLSLLLVARLKVSKVVLLENDFRLILALRGRFLRLGTTAFHLGAATLALNWIALHRNLRVTVHTIEECILELLKHGLEPL
jgi:hypothetical protein